MRFSQLDLIAYGGFSGRTLSFDPNGPGLILILGANEAGKSTTLQAISDLLFGIPSRTPYNFLHDYREMRIGGAINQLAGDSLQIQRRKGGKKTLSSEDGKALDESVLKPFLGGMDRGSLPGEALFER
ncbi:MAG: AAA family ATPase [Magnetococcales bacterium]|nr:AAA family ATPase [Magnetococcales bacterium]